MNLSSLIPMLIHHHDFSCLRDFINGIRLHSNITVKQDTTVIEEFISLLTYFESTPPKFSRVQLCSGSSQSGIVSYSIYKPSFKPGLSPKIIERLRIHGFNEILASNIFIKDYTIIIYDPKSLPPTLHVQSFRSHQLLSYKLYTGNREHLLFLIRKYLSSPQQITKKVVELLSISLYYLLKSISSSLALHYRYKRLSLHEFLGLTFLDANPLNRSIRHTQYSHLLRNYQLKTVASIFQYYSCPANMNRLNHTSIQPEMYLLDSSIPPHLNLDYWTNGNAYFTNCLIYGFRKHVECYSDQYSVESLSPHGSSRYYASRPSMNDSEIKELLLQSPLILDGNQLTAGRHRVVSIIGHLLSGRNYIPFFVDRLPSLSS